MRTRQRTELVLSGETRQEGSTAMTLQSSKDKWTWSERTKMLAAGLLVAVMACLMLAASPAYASNIHTVNENGDQSDTNPGDGVCDADIAPGVGGCTLRAAIQESNDNPGPDRINFNLPFQTIRPDSQLPAIRNQTTID